MKNNPMACDLETGICGVVEENETGLLDFSRPNKEVEVYFFSDPICSHCWALEPEIAKFTAAYGDTFKMHTVMGGLLPSWDGFADVSNGIGGPKDVAGHWREVGEYYRMPIDGSLWLDNPVHSSYPPSRVWKVVQSVKAEATEIFLRKLREAVFAFNENIADEEVLIRLVDEIGLDGKEIVEKANSEEGERLLQQDFELAQRFGVSGFPTIIMVNKENKGVKIVGQRRYEDYTNGLMQALGQEELLKANKAQALPTLLSDGRRLFSKEIETIYGIERAEVEEFVLQSFPQNGVKSGTILGEIYYVQA